MTAVPFTPAELLQAEATKELERRRQLAWWRMNPADYMRDRLGLLTWPKLEEILNSIVHHRQTAVKSANGIGKTTAAAAIVIWFLETHFEEPTIVVTTGSNGRTLSDVLWPRISTLIRKHKIFPQAQPYKQRIWIDNEHYAVSVSTNNPEGLQGFHAANLLQIVEESSGIEEDIASAIAGNATGVHDRRLYLGNPLVPHGVFYDWCNSPEVNTITVSALEHPNVIEGREIYRGAVTRESLEEKCASEWGREVSPSKPGALILPWCGRAFDLNNHGVPRVLGEFPQTSAFGMIPRPALMECVERKDRKRFGRVVVGLDPAASEFGDESAFAVACDGGILHIEAHRGLDQMQLAGLAMKLMKDWGASTMGVDIGGGYGGGVYSRLREQGVPVVQVDFSLASSNPQRWANTKAEIYYIFQDAVLHDPGFYVPNDPIFIRQAVEIRQTQTSRGQDAIESKEQYKSRTGESPDRFEAAVIAKYLLRFASAGANLDIYIPEEEEEPEPDHIRNEMMWHR